MSPPAPGQGGSPLSRYRAERLLRKEFAELRSKVLAIVRSQLRGKGIALDPADLEACYAQAWHGLYATVLGGERVENPSAWLVLVTFRRAIDESRAGESCRGRRRVEKWVPYPSEVGRHWHPILQASLTTARACGRCSRLCARASPRASAKRLRCAICRVSRGPRRPTRMGISEARMRKLMEGAGPGRPGVAGKVGELLDTDQGRRLV